jgi:uncharacterized delta-60 repeat protein
MASRWFERASLGALLILPALVPTARLQPLPARGASLQLEPQSAAGDLDPSFGNGGKVTTDFSGNNDVATCVAIQADGKIVVGGTSTDPAGNSDFALARYNTDGSLDTNFGSGGKVTTDFFHDNDSLNAIAIQPDGKIVAAGSASRPGQGPQFGVARYNPDGSLDLSFGSAGKTTTNFPGQDIAYAIAIAPGGKFIVVGTSSVQPVSEFALARYNPDASLDTTFGVNGKVVNSIRGLVDDARAAVLQPDGKLIIAGTHNQGDGFALFRYNTDGTPDNSFGASGAVTTAVSLSSGATALALQPDGKIVAAGSSESDAIKTFFALARYNPDGSLDTTFNEHDLRGFAQTSLTSADDAATAIALQGDGKILAAGVAGDPGEFGTGSSDFAITRYKQTGVLDPSFGTNGKVVTDFFGRNDSARGIALQSDGKIILAGVAQAKTNVFALARYLVENFTLAFDPPVINGARGTTVPVGLLINREGGFTGSVTITPPDTSAIGIKLKPAGPVDTTRSRIKVKLKITSSAPLGAHLIIFTANDDQGRVRTVAVTLNIE